MLVLNYLVMMTGDQEQTAAKAEIYLGKEISCELLANTHT